MDGDCWSGKGARSAFDGGSECAFTKRVLNARKAEASRLGFAACKSMFGASNARDEVLKLENGRAEQGIAGKIGVMGAQPLPIWKLVELFLLWNPADRQRPRHSVLDAVSGEEGWKMRRFRWNDHAFMP